MDGGNRIERLAVEAVERAAAGLGVEPLKLAEWLRDEDRLAHMLYLAGRGHEMPSVEYRRELVVSLSEFLEFLEEQGV
ncbi:MAG: hypothetical protein FWJ74_03215 [Gemmatimonadota bacterium]|jgi:hypothetical protein